MDCAGWKSEQGFVARSASLRRRQSLASDCHEGFALQGKYRRQLARGLNALRIAAKTVRACKREPSRIPF